MSTYTLHQPKPEATMTIPLDFFTYSVARVIQTAPQPPHLWRIARELRVLGWRKFKRPLREVFKQLKQMGIIVEGANGAGHAVYHVPPSAPKFRMAGRSTNSRAAKIAAHTGDHP